MLTDFIQKAIPYEWQWIAWFLLIVIAFIVGYFIGKNRR